MYREKWRKCCCPNVYVVALLAKPFMDIGQYDLLVGCYTLAQKGLVSTLSSFLSKPHCPYPRLLLLFSIAVRTRLGRNKGFDGKFNKIRRIMMSLMNEPDAGSLEQISLSNIYINTSLRWPEYIWLKSRAIKNRNELKYPNQEGLESRPEFNRSRIFLHPKIIPVSGS